MAHFLAYKGKDRELKATWFVGSGMPWNSNFPIAASRQAGKYTDCVRGPNPLSTVNEPNGSLALQVVLAWRRLVLLARTRYLITKLGLACVRLF